MSPAKDRYYLQENWIRCTSMNPSHWHTSRPSLIGVLLDSLPSKSIAFCPILHTSGTDDSHGEVCESESTPAAAHHQAAVAVKSAICLLGPCATSIVVPTAVHSFEET